MVQVVIEAQELDVEDKVFAAERKDGMRLNNDMKREVVNNAIHHAFSPRFAALLKVEHALARDALLSVFGEAAMRHIKALAHEVYKGMFFRVCKDRCGNNIKEGISISFTFGYHSMTARTLLPTPAMGFVKNIMVKDAAIIERASEWASDVHKLKEEETKTTTTLHALLAKISTYPSLERNWPAGNRFYKHLPKKYPYRHQVPAVMIDELNKSLGI